MLLHKRLQYQFILYIISLYSINAVERVMVRDGFLLSHTLKVNIFVVGRPSSPLGCVCVCLCVCVCVFVCVCVCVCVYVCVSVVYACTYLCECMYVHVCVAVTYGTST